MEQNYGGPVWHASVSLHGPDGPIPLTLLNPDGQAVLCRVAQYLLRGVGDAALGEWKKNGGVAFHLRRRLTEAEWGGKPWGMDYRGTPEGARRLEAVSAYLPRGYRE